MSAPRAPRPRGRRPRLGLLVAALATALVATGCATPKRLPAVPRALEAQAAPTVPDVRILVARDTAPALAEAQSSLEKQRAWLASQGRSTSDLPPVAFLAISGGGDDGAFGAGLLNGWSAAGTRPEFQVVTGISTGALAAPFAFLGSRYDGQLRAVYTQVSKKDIFKERSLLNGVFGDAMADTAPLQQLVARFVDRALLDAIAAEYAKGRLLLVGTTNLDSLEPVIWNMTAIAASSDPRAPELFRKVLLASAAIPGAFPPVLIDVTAGGQHYQEMHVDGGAMAQVFIYPPSIDLSTAGPRRQRTLYIIRNARLDPDWASTKRRTLPIAGRAVSSLIQTQGLGDLYRIYLTAQRDGLDYNLAYIPRTFDIEHKDQFDPVYMGKLFQAGYDLAAAGYPWQKTPPGFGLPPAAAAAIH